MSELALRIVDPGRATSLQDLGRLGRADLGVPRAGAVDRETHDLANRVVGNDPRAATIETHGGLVVEALRAIVVAVDGDRHTLAAGTRLRIDRQDDRMWMYLAIRGGIDVEPVLGSRSHDTLAGVGPPPIDLGTELPAGPDPGSALPTDQAPVRHRGPVVRLWAGPRADHFVDALGTLLGHGWTVSGSVSRVGVRLEAGTFTPSTAGRLASEGLVAGAIQITPAGEPIVMLANHPTTGGYPVVAVVDPADLSIVAQSPPGTVLRFIRA